MGVSRSLLLAHRENGVMKIKGNGVEVVSIEDSKKSGKGITG